MWVGYERTKYANIPFASHICIDSYSEMNIGETWSISLPSTWSKVSSTKKKQIVNIFGQKLIWREVCWTNSLPSTVLYWKSIIKYSKALIWVITQCFVVMSSLNVNRNLHKVVYKKLEKYIEIYRLFLICLSLYQTNLQSSLQSRYMFNIKKSLLIDALNFIPREAKYLLRIAPRIAIDLLKGRYLFKDFVKVKQWTDRPLAV